MATTPINRLSRFFELVRDHPRRRRALSIGDSWFQYPLRPLGDLQNLTAARLHGKVEFLDDSWPGRDAREVPALLRRWRGIARDLDERLGKPFELIMVSLGGNDVIGTDFGRHLKHAIQPASMHPWPFAPTIPTVVRDHLRVDSLHETFRRVGDAYRSLRSLRDDFAPRANIITHTYADVIPSNTAYQLPGLKSGPWMWDEMNSVGLTDPDRQRELSRWLLESFAGLLRGIAQEHAGFFVLDTRLEIGARQLWDNEIHPTRAGYRQLVDRHWLPAVRTALSI